MSYGCPYGNQGYPDPTDYESDGTNSSGCPPYHQPTLLGIIIKCCLVSLVSTPFIAFKTQDWFITFICGSLILIGLRIIMSWILSEKIE